MVLVLVQVVTVPVRPDRCLFPFASRLKRRIQLPLLPAQYRSSCHAGHGELGSRSRDPSLNAANRVAVTAPASGRASLPASDGGLRTRP